MQKSLDKLYKNQSLIYKYVLYIVSILLIVFFFPKGGKFKYEFQKGKPWQYDNLYAPFDFSIKKNPLEIEKEQLALKSKQINYYDYDNAIANEVYALYETQFTSVFNDSLFNKRKRKLCFITKRGKLF